MNLLKPFINAYTYAYKRTYHRCPIHEVELEVWSGARDKYEYGIIKGHIECPECYPDLFKDYREKLDRFDVELHKAKDEYVLGKFAYGVEKRETIRSIVEGHIHD